MDTFGNFWTSLDIFFKLQFIKVNILLNFEIFSSLALLAVKQSRHVPNLALTSVFKNIVPFSLYTFLKILHCDLKNTLLKIKIRIRVTKKIFSLS